ncbi:uncharacterized protein LOC130928259 [Corythoichthys intestinalis]|uniref:uncharacterized protein LOC130928259 n=1 Tax=Corythoichthys intestinalis TaxID=161448 RepID=UPI0025A5A356|nr:uncharacterized protein LOC130928259 [Corythoichthys intestinalis]
MSKALPSPSGLIRDMADNPRRSQLNGALRRSSRSRDEDTLRFLSPEEKECLQFFEETIGSLENSLEEDELKAGLAKTPGSGSLLDHEMDGPSPTRDLSRVPSLSARRLSAKDQDIIDLVRPDPDLLLAKLAFNPTSPDFQKMATNPESHFEIKPRHDPADHAAVREPTDGHSYHPAGSVPTPVLIAKKIAENQAEEATVGPSLLQRRRSREGDKSSGHGEDLPTKQGPPTFAKPTRYPANISMILGNKDLQNQPVSNVNLHDRRALVMSNLTGGPQVLLPEESVPNLAHKSLSPPTRSISFNDPTPEKTRMEALSKLGLARNRALSGGTSVPDTVDGAATRPIPSAEISVTNRLPQIETGEVPTLPQGYTSTKKAETLYFESPRSFEDKKPPVSPPHVEKTSPAAQPSDIISLELNSFGGKSIVVTPGPAKKEPATAPASSEANVVPSVLSNPSEFNSYGGKSKIVNPATGAMTKSDLPDILSSHIDVNRRPRLLPAELNSYGGKSRTIDPSAGVRLPAGSAPNPAPRNPQTSHRKAGADAAARAKSTSDVRRKPAPMFRPQGVTVQFSGRAANEESRKQALKKLGLLKES